MRLDPDLLTELAREFGLPATQGAIALVARDAVDVAQVNRQSGMVEVVAEMIDDGLVSVDLDIDDRDLELVDYTCTRDGPFGCAHVLASLLTIVSSHGAGPPAPPAAPWQRALDSMLPAAELTQDVGRAFFVGVVDPTAGRNAWAYGRRRSPFLGVRPAVRGQRGAWIKGNVDWRSLTYLDSGALADQLISDFYGLYAIHGGRESYYAPEWLPLEDFSSRGLLTVLAELQAAGVPLVSTGKQQRPLTLAAEPATIRIAAQERRKRLRVTAELLLDGEPTEARSVHPVGSPAVAVATVAHPGEPAEHVTLHPLDQPASPALWRMLRSTDTVSVDAAGRARFETDYLPRLRALAPVVSPDDSYDVPDPARLTLHLAVAMAGEDLELRWAWSGTVPGSPPDSHERGAILARVRDAVGDHRVLVYGGRPGDEPTDRVLTGADAVILVAEVLPGLRELDQVEVTITESVPDYRATATGPQVSVEARPGENDWFDLHVRVDVDGQQVEFAQVFRSLAAGEPIFVLPDGRYFSLTGPEFDRLRAIIEEARSLDDRHVESLRISRYQSDLWAELVELGIVAAQEQEWLTALQALTDAATLDPVPTPAGVHAELRHYQQSGLAWLTFLRRNRLGGILGDDMGLGKTLQVIAMMEAAREEDLHMPPFLVVAPTSVVGNWERECHRFAPGLRVVTIDATERRRGAPLAEAVAGAHVVVTSYTLMRLEEDGYRELPWSGLVLDEAQMIKNHRSQAYRSARLIEAPVKLAVTGTPMENNLTELWALTSLVCPGLLGSESTFTELYRKPIEKDRSTDRLARLQRRLRPFLLRRRKEDVASELPPKQEQVLELELHPGHRRLYELRLQRERQKVLGLLDDVEAHRFQVFQSLTLLRQLALDADLVEGEHSAAGNRPPSAKLEALNDLLTEAASEGHRVLVFSQFTRFLGKARAQAEAAGIATAYLDGGTARRARDREIERFRAGEVPAFFISLKAGGFGLNLTEADYVVLLDPWWNPATEAQAVDRTHRIGQTRSVMVYRLVSAGTIEGKVLSLSARKAKLFSDVLDGGDATSAGALTADEIRELVS